MKQLMEINYKVVGKGLTIMLFLVCIGCGSTVKPEIIKVPESPNYSFINNVIPPPDPKTYEIVEDDSDNLKEYTDKLNWYMIYMFSYTKVVNELAMQEGWKPSTEDPLCRIGELPPMHDIPRFNARNLENLEEELIGYIKVLRKLHESDAEAIDKASRQLKKNCIY